MDNFFVMGTLWTKQKICGTNLHRKYRQNEVRNHLAKHKENAGKHFTFTYEEEIFIQNFYQ